VSEEKPSPRLHREPEEKREFIGQDEGYRWLDRVINERKADLKVAEGTQRSR
jgi:hypothetical protein